jgi:hypothetical protein
VDDWATTIGGSTTVNKKAIINDLAGGVEILIDEILKEILFFGFGT